MDYGVHFMSRKPTIEPAKVSLLKSWVQWVRVVNQDHKFEGFNCEFPNNPNPKSNDEWVVHTSDKNTQTYTALLICEIKIILSKCVYDPHFLFLLRFLCRVIPQQYRTSFILLFSEVTNAISFERRKALTGIVQAQ